MQNVTLTQTEANAMAAGGVLGGMLASVGIFTLIIYVLLIIAWWKIFEKAGEKGWKALIPIYNTYILCRIVDLNFWIYLLLIPFVCGVLAGLVPALSFVGSIYIFVIDIILAIKLGDAFKKSTAFKVGLVLLAPIFYMILAFGDSKYHHAKKSEEKK